MKFINCLRIYLRICNLFKGTDSALGYMTKSPK
jgi:hypothetical protein